MSQPPSPHSVASFRAITYRISSTPTKSLPFVAAQIAGSIWKCKDVFSASSQGAKSQTETAGLVHRFRTTITSLLQDRTIEGRWAAIVFTKAAIEAGGVESLSKSNVWTRSLLAILKKPDPPTTRQLAVVTLTRAFMLTWDHSNLVREITTPALPNFISTCLNNVERERCSAVELETVLEAFATLLPRHPTVFRPYESHIRSLVFKILSSTSSSLDNDTTFSRKHEEVARRLLVLLHHGAPKQGGAESWDIAWKATITAAHATCDQLFRSLVEDTESTANGRHSVPVPNHLSSEVGSDTNDAVGLTPWNGIFAGSERLMTLLGVLQSHLETSATGSLTIRIGLLVELLSRIMSLTVDLGAESSRINHQISKNEREALFCVLPEIHVATLKLIATMLRRFGRASASFARLLLEHILGAFNAQNFDGSIRAAVYAVMKMILDIIGPSLSKVEVAHLAQASVYCCQDLLPDSNNTAARPLSKVTHVDTTNGIGTAYSKSPLTRPLKHDPLITSATHLLTTLATKLNPSDMPRKLRVQLERTAILTRNKDALVALVLNPAMKHSGGKLETSLLPILARKFADVPEVEALLRPKIVPVSLQRGDGVVNGHGEEAEEDVVEGDVGEEAGYGMKVGQAERPVWSLDGVGRAGNHAFAEWEGEELYSLTPPRQEYSDPRMNANFEIDTDPPLQPMLNGTKRRADVQAVEPDASIKRPRYPQATEPAEIEHPNKSVSATPPLALTESVTTMTEAEPSVGQSAFARQPEATPAGTVNEPQRDSREDAAQDDVGSDESDFEMPPLTMEPDTDPEDDDDSSN